MGYNKLLSREMKKTKPMRQITIIQSNLIRQHFQYPNLTRIHYVLSIANIFIM
jgi:hypothetical protein